MYILIMLHYLQDKYNIPLDIRYLIKEQMDILGKNKMEVEKNKRIYNEVILNVKYYSFINKKINKRKKTCYTIISTIKHFD
jgi:hypothetical protein